jgi:hypothetical protein
VVLTLLVAMEGRPTAGAPSRGEGLVAWHQMYSVLAHSRSASTESNVRIPSTTENSETEEE